LFIDEIKIYAQAGHGGPGCIAFVHEAYRAKGGPSGGNGGRGGSVILEADHDLNNLINQYYAPRLIAEKGQHGLGKGMDGRAGKDLIVKVPCGTLIWRLPGNPASEAEPEEQEPELNPPKPLRLGTSERAVMRYHGSKRALEFSEIPEPAAPTGPDHLPEGATLFADLTQHGQRMVLCQGGRGGLGNRNFATARRQTPRFAQPGEAGDEGDFLLELRLMAEIGLVGFPNAGKSTLLSAISDARPKIAPYPFTTLHPQVGILVYPEDFFRLTICDVPGLIAGAHRNVGLGHAFLRHIVRCKVLVLLLDMAGTDGRPPWDDYHQLLDELRLYHPALLDRARLVVANKIDEPAAVENLKKFKRKIRKTPVLPIAAAFDIGISEFKAAIRQAVAAAHE
jgi:GTPase